MFAPRPVPAPVDAPVPATPEDGTVVPFLDPLSNRRDVFPDDFTTSLTPDVGWTLGVAARPGEHATLAGFLLDARVLTNRYNLNYGRPHDGGAAGRITRVPWRGGTIPRARGVSFGAKGARRIVVERWVPFAALRHGTTTPSRDRQHDRHTPGPGDIRPIGVAPTSRRVNQR